MFDLFRTRQKAVRLLLGAVLVAVSAAMVITLIPGFGSNTGDSGNDPVVAQIGNQKLTVSEVTRNAQRFMRSSQIPPDLIPAYLPQLLDSMIQQRAVVYQFQQLGLTATDEEVLAGMEAQFAQFFQNGQLVARDQLVAMLAQNDMTLDDAINNTRQQVILDKIQNMEYASTVVSPDEIKQAEISKTEKAKIKYVAFPPAKFRDQAKVGPEEIKAYYDSHRAQFNTPAKRSFQVVVVDQDQVEKTIAVSDAQLRAAYSSSMDSFRTPERVHLRHHSDQDRGQDRCGKEAASGQGGRFRQAVERRGGFRRSCQEEFGRRFGRQWRRSWLDRQGGRLIPDVGEGRLCAEAQGDQRHRDGQLWIYDHAVA